MWYYDSLQFGCTRITKANIAIQIARIYQYPPNTWTEKNFPEQYFKKIFQSIKYFNILKSTRT
jgi:hypothetical protein